MNDDSTTQRINAVPHTFAPLAIIAGNGDLPLKIAHAQCERRVVVVIAIDGQTPRDIAKNLPPCTPLFWSKIGMVGQMLSFLKQYKVSDVTLAGGIQRPRMRDLAVDMMGARWLKVIGMNAFKGDDHLLRAVVGLLESEGLSVVSAHDLMPDLLIEKGIHTYSHPSADQLQDIAFGRDILSALSPFDIGQAIAVRDGCVLGIETIGGTQMLLRHVQELIESDAKDIGQSMRLASGVLIKTTKQNQSRKVDMPTIGVDTVSQVAATGLKGIAIAADGVQILDKDAVIASANAHQLFIFAF